MQKDVILNGTDSLAVAKEAGLVYRLEPVKQFNVFSVTNLRKGVAKKINLSKSLDGDQFVVYAVGDVIDDTTEVPGTYDDSFRDMFFECMVKTIENGEIINRSLIRVNRQPSLVHGTILEKNSVITIQPNKDACSITFYCTPILLSKAVNLLEDTTFEPQLSSPT